MATTIKISDTQVWCSGLIVQRPTSGVYSPTEPALTTANKIMQSILAAPFKWEWNRTVLPAAITTVAGTSDYSVSMPLFGYLEVATATYATPPANVPPTWQLDLYKVLAKDGKQNRPQKIATLLDDNANNITFRLFPVPDAIYAIDLVYQRAPVVATALSNTWAPIPDKMAYLYEQGFLAHMHGIYNLAAMLQGMELFYRMLVSAAEGLSEAEKAIFLEESLRQLKTRAAEISGIQQGKAARLA